MFTERLFSVRKLDDFVPTSHPLRSIRVMANEALPRQSGLTKRSCSGCASG
jgi:hypothetical protein